MELGLLRLRKPSCGAHTSRAQRGLSVRCRCRAGRRASRGRLTRLAGRVLLRDARVEARAALLVAQRPVDAGADVVTVPASRAGVGLLRFVPGAALAVVFEGFASARNDHMWVKVAKGGCARVRACDHVILSVPRDRERADEGLDN